MMIPPREAFGDSEGRLARLSFSNAIRAGGFVFVSGQPGIDEHGQIPDGVEAQTRQAFANLASILADAGSSLDQVVRFTTMLRDIQDLSTVVKVRGELLTEPFPADTVFEVAALARPGFLVEIDCVALASD